MFTLTTPKSLEKFITLSGTSETYLKRLVLIMLGRPEDLNYGGSELWRLHLLHLNIKRVE